MRRRQFAVPYRLVVRQIDAGLVALLDGSHETEVNTDLPRVLLKLLPHAQGRHDKPAAAGSFED
jgi:hypothetical protein